MFAARGVGLYIIHRVECVGNEVGKIDDGEDITRSSQPSPIRRRDTQPAITMLHQDSSKPANFVMHLLHRLLETFILDGKSFDFGLELVEPCFLALTAFKGGCLV